MTADTQHPQNSRPGEDEPTKQNAALRGASLAFGKPPVKPKPQINNYSGDGWALSAAAKAGGGSPRQKGKNNGSKQEARGDSQNLSNQNAGSSVGDQSYTGGSERPNIQQRISQLGGTSFLSPPRGTADPSKSPSFIAATLAASRSASVSPNPTGQRQAQWHGTRSPSVRSGGSSSRESMDQSLDTRPIPPTTSLIGLFEQNAASSELKRPPVKRLSTSATRRSPGAPRSTSPLPVRTVTPSTVPTKPQKPEVKSPKPALKQVGKQPVQSDPPKPTPRAAKPVLSTPKPTSISAKPTTRPPQTVNDNDDASSEDSFVSASDYKPSFRATLTEQNRRLTSGSKVSINSEAATIDSLANAIVASSLASSRAASPSRNLAHQQSLYPPPPPPSRKNNHSARGYLFQPITKEISRTPSPAKQVGLLTTMRKPKSKEELDEGERKRGRRNLMKKHPHKHHEGDRKRWRDSITERERKRYEAVWASNKGLFMSGPDGNGDENTVCSLVVRDIFSRSRLHNDELEELYSLVDRNGNGRLEREEFVVGLWLIDQRLKGRKLPIKVSDSVWKSVGVIGRIKVRKAGK